MFNIVLFEPEIPPNTGNIIRLCANTQSYLHLIEPMGFELSDKTMRRAGLDYINPAMIIIYKDFQEFLKRNKNINLYALSTKGKIPYHKVAYKKNDFFMFGPETRGIPQSIRKDIGSEKVLKIPMVADNRSINLANTVSIVLFEAWRQNNFQNGI